MRILGIDPGLTRCGVGVVDVSPDRRASLVHVGVVRSPVDASVGDRLAIIARGIREVLDAYRPDAAAVERVFAQHNVQSVMATAQASGVALMLAAERGIPTGTHTPSEVKAAITGYGSADKRQVQNMVARVLGLAELPKPADAADALAVALCHGWRSAGAPVSPNASEGLTPAQRAWAAAERGATRVARTSVRTRR